MNRVIAPAILVAGALCLVVGTLGSCGPPKVIKATPKPAAQPVEAQPDYFDRFDGQKYDPGQEIELTDTPIGVRGVRLIMSLVKVDWVAQVSPTGEEIREGTAEIVIQRGDETKRIRLDQGGSRTILGARIEVHWAGVLYDDDRMQWLPQAKILVAAAP